MKEKKMAKVRNKKSGTSSPWVRICGRKKGSAMERKGPLGVKQFQTWLYNNVRLWGKWVFAFGVERTLYGQGKGEGISKKKSPLQWTWPDLTLVLAKVSRFSSCQTNSFLMAKQQDSAFVFCLFNFLQNVF